MDKTELKQRVQTSVNEAIELSEYWVGTLNEQVVRQHVNELLDDMNVENVEKLENTLSKVRVELERSENEG